MIKTILIDYEPTAIQQIKSNIQAHCQQIRICGAATTCQEASKLIDAHEPALAFVDATVSANAEFSQFQDRSLSNLETIYLSNSSTFALDAFKYQASGFILKPIQIPDLVQTVRKVQQRIEQKRQALSTPPKGLPVDEKTLPGNLVGIPTMEGFDFIPANAIIRCEGMHKCTRIITETKEDLISSYNIGTFIRMLSPYPFFSTHKSHLINLTHIKRYYKEGSIKMKDGSCVPVSKRRKRLFLERMHLIR